MFVRVMNWADDNLADPFTKALPNGKLTQHARSMRLHLATPRFMYMGLVVGDFSVIDGHLGVKGAIYRMCRKSCDTCLDPGKLPPCGVPLPDQRAGVEGGRSKLKDVKIRQFTPSPGLCRGGDDGPITILTIDGGGVRRIIPSVILKYLEEELQKLDGKDARMVNYFDVMVGTSMGALIVSMLSAPDLHRNRRPMFTTQDIVDFYFEHSPLIFPPRWAPQNLIQATSPKYNGIHLHNTVRGLLQDLRVGDALTNILVPAFDICVVQPVIFSSFKAHDPLMNVKLSDLCLGTTAAPIYLPPYFFKMQHQAHREFHLLDGVL
ncbi:patatin-like protein 1 [Tanacetum coccineum]